MAALAPPQYIYLCMYIIFSVYYNILYYIQKIHMEEH